MGNVLTALTSEKETTSRKKDLYESSFSHRRYNMGPTISVAGPRMEKKELPKTTQVTTQRSPRVLRESTTLDSFWDDLHAKNSKQQEKLPKTSQTTTQRSPRVLREPTTLDSFWDDLHAKTQISELKENNFGNLTDSNREDVKKVTEIVRHILRNYDEFEGVYGNWSCRRLSSCNNEDEWQILFNKVSLQSYLQLTPEKKYDFFKRSCKKCNKESTISSFFLCKQRPTFLKDAVEIICHLEWNNHYRVFADWECQRPQYGHSVQHKWKSSYTWISLQKFIEQASTNDLSRKDFYKQKCHECRENCSNCKDKPKKFRGCVKCNYEGAIKNYGCLVLSGGGAPHKRWLCAKCQGGAICVRTDDNRRPIRRNRNVLLH